MAAAAAEPFDPRVILADIEAMVAATALKKGVGWSVSVDPTVPARLLGDPLPPAPRVAEPVRERREVYQRGKRGGVGVVCGCPIADVGASAGGRGWGALLPCIHDRPRGCHHRGPRARGGGCPCCRFEAAATASTPADEVGCGPHRSFFARVSGRDPGAEVKQQRCLHAERA